MFIQWRRIFINVLRYVIWEDKSDCFFLVSLEAVEGTTDRKYLADKRGGESIEGKQTSFNSIFFDFCVLDPTADYESILIGF